MGAGVNLFKTLFAEDYYPYTANTLMSAKPTSKVVVGKNLFDDDIIVGARYNGNFNPNLTNYWTCRNLIRILPNTQYVFSGLITDGQIGFYDSNQTFISSVNTYINVTFTTPSNAMYLSVYNTNTSRDYEHQLEFGSSPTAYEPYSQTTITLSGVELRGLIKVGTNGLYCDGDIDDGSGTGEVRYEERAYQAGDESLANAITDGTTTVVKLATPTTQTLTAWNNPIKACDGGTEEFTDTRAIKLPSGHDTVYGTDLIAKTADFGTTVYGGSFDFTTGELISDKNADGTDKAPETISLTPMTVPARSGDNYIITDADGSNSVKYFDAI